MTRTSTIAANTQLISQMLRTQLRLQDLQTQIATEKKAEQYSGIARDSQRLIQMESARDQLDRFVKLNEQGLTRLNVATTVLGALDTSLRNFQGDLASFKQQGTTTAQDIAFIQGSAFRALRELEDMLNTEVDGRYLFSGSRARTQPVDFGIGSVAGFQEIFDGAIVTAPTTRDAHLASFSFSKDENNKTKLHVDAANFLQFRRDGDGDATSAGSSTIRATSALFSNVEVGTTIEVTNTGSNNGTYTVKSVSSDGTTVTVQTEMLTDENLRIALTTEAPAGAVAFLQEDGTTLTSGAGDISFNQATGVITDASGTLFAGVAVGDYITVSGSGSNNATFRVDAVGPGGSSITIDDKPARLTGLTGLPVLTQVQTGALTFNRANDTITAAVADSLAGLTVGSAFTVSGTDENNATYTVEANDGTTLTVRALKLTDEGLSGTTFFDHFSDTDVEFVNATKTIEVRQSGTATAVANIFKGLAVGDQITVAGSASNNGTFTIATIANDFSSVTVEETVTNETDTTGATFTGSGNAFSYRSGTQIAFTDVGAAGTDTIQMRDSGGAALAGGFSALKVGETFTVSGTAAHNGTYTISAISGDGSTVTVEENITATATDTDGARIQVFAADGTVSATSYFNGDMQSQTHRLDRDREVEFTLNAADPAFEKAVRAIKLIMQGAFGTEGGLENNMARVEQASYLLASALEATVQGTPPFGEEETGSLEIAAQDVGFQAFLLKEINTQHKSFIGFFESSAAEAENANPLEVITRLLDDQRSLEASYQAFSRIRSLSLLDFL
jgi:flagellar hook-associated protein 3 FlgL